MERRIARTSITIAMMIVLSMAALKSSLPLDTPTVSLVDDMDRCKTIILEFKDPNLPLTSIRRRTWCSVDDRHSGAQLHNGSHQEQRSMQTLCMKMTPSGPRGNYPVFPRALLSCADVLASGMNVSGIYGIYPVGNNDPLKVYCDMTTAGGGWTVFQRRINGSVDFNANWSLYKNGFGSLWGEHWLGNENVYHLTNQRPCKLRIDLYDFKGNTRHATYTHFRITNESMKYELRLDSWVHGGGAGDCLKQHSGNKFSTIDQDNDLYEGFHCAESYQAGWWYINSSSRTCNLNGIYMDDDWFTIARFNRGILWSCWGWSTLKGSEMKLRPLSEE